MWQWKPHECRRRPTSLGAKVVDRPRSFSSDNRVTSLDNARSGCRAPLGRRSISFSGVSGKAPIVTTACPNRITRSVPRIPRSTRSCSTRCATATSPAAGIARFDGRALVRGALPAIGLHLAGGRAAGEGADEAPFRGLGAPQRLRSGDRRGNAHPDYAQLDTPRHTITVDFHKCKARLIKQLPATWRSERSAVAVPQTEAPHRDCGEAPKWR